MSESIVLTVKEAKKLYESAIEEFATGDISLHDFVYFAKKYIDALEKINAEYAHVIGRTMG
jgi:hypothetical protein